MPHLFINMKLTKIVSTYGPAIDSTRDIERLIQLGVNVFRFNLKHNSLDWHEERIKNVKNIAQRLGEHIGVLIDLQGPEIRLSTPGKYMDIENEDVIELKEQVFASDENSLSLSYPKLIASLVEGQRVFADDGKFSFTVFKKQGQTYLRSLNQGRLLNRKSLNIPGLAIKLPTLYSRDIEGLKLAKTCEVDFIALSYVRSTKDLLVLRREMRTLEVQSQVVSKIETKMAIDSLDDILTASDGVMVARGDLGVELPIERVPYYQKFIIKRAIEIGKPVITATEMLQSMILAPQPSRAEVSDIANATYDYSDAVMLSGETATGKYPLDAVEVMRKTIEFNERKFNLDTRDRFDLETKEQEGLIANAAYDLYLKIKTMKQKLHGFIVFTQTGKTARMLSRFRPALPVYTFCPSPNLARLLTLHFGIHPFVHNHHNLKGEFFSQHQLREVISLLLKKKFVRQGDRLILLRAVRWGDEDNTSTVQLLTCVE